MLDYDTEADRYDATRGGWARAEAAAVAVDELLPPDARRVLDVGAGTGTVGAALAALGRTVAGSDRSGGMLAQAAARLPGRRVQADATRLPFAAGAFDAAYLMWVLHLVPDPAVVLGECARVVRPAGRVVTSIDVHAMHIARPSDVTDVLERYAPLRAASYETDDRDRLLGLAAAAGLRFAGETTYVGHGRGVRPAMVAGMVRRHDFRWTARLGEAEIAACARDLEQLPDQDVPRADPTYTLLAFEVAPRRHDK